MYRLTPVLVLATVLLMASPLIAAYLDGPPPAHTGGFDEPSCRACHFGAEPNDPAGALALAGVPDHYTPGQRYILTITLGREAMARGGFQLSARFAAGMEAGSQAGSLAATGDRVEVVSNGEPVQYAHHTADGVVLTQDASARWKVEWTAPGAGGNVVFHVAGNAANGDDSAFGDYIYTTRATTRPAGSADPVCGGSDLSLPLTPAICR